MGEENRNKKEELGPKCKKREFWAKFEIRKERNKRRNEKGEDEQG